MHFHIWICRCTHTASEKSLLQQKEWRETHDYTWFLQTSIHKILVSICSTTPPIASIKTPPIPPLLLLCLLLNKKVTFFCNYKNRIPASISTRSWDSSIAHLTIESLNPKRISVACIIKFHCNLMIQILVPKFLSCRGCDWLMGFFLIKLHGKIKVQIFGEHFELVLWGFLCGFEYLSCGWG